MLALRLREKVVEVLVLVEHLEIFASPQGLEVFGSLCELLGRCCKYVATGRRDQAIQAMTTAGRGIPHAFPFGQERDLLEAVLEEILTLLEMPETDRLH